MTTKTMTAIEMNTMYHTCNSQSVHEVMILQSSAWNTDPFEDVIQMKMKVWRRRQR